MELIRDTPFEAAWQVWKSPTSKQCLTLIVKGTFSLVESGACPIAGQQQLPTGDIHQDGDPEASVRTESDFAHIKPKGECFVVGSCYAPGKSAAPVVLVAFTIGPVGKKMAVIGDRYFKGFIAKQTEPEPFKVMPLCWERSFGGSKSAVNPVGIGLDKIPIGEKKKRHFPLPNIENPEALMRSRRQNPPPVGSFPIPKSWKQRIAHAGRYSQKWLDSKWPGLPDDFQWRYFNAAPEDQQISGYFKGDEVISLINLHPVHQRIRCRLPGLRATALLRRADGGTSIALRPDLDTITVDTDNGTVTCLWRAITEIGAETLDEFSEVFVVHEDIKVDRSLEDYEEWHERRKEELLEEEKAVEAQPIPDPDVADVRAEDVSPVVIPRRKETGAAALGANDEPGWCGTQDLTTSVRPVPVPLSSPTITATQEPEEVDPLLGGENDVEATIQSFISGEQTNAMDMRVVMTLIAEEKEAQMTELSFQKRLDEASELLKIEPEEHGEHGEPFWAGLLDPEPEVSAETDAFEGAETIFKGTSTAFLAEIKNRAAAGDADSNADNDPYDSAETIFSGASTAFLANLGKSPEPPKADLVEPPRVGPAPAPGDDSGTDEDGEPEPSEPHWMGDRGPAPVGLAPTVPTETPPTKDELERKALRLRVEAAIAAHESCARWDLSDVDLSGLDLRSADFSGALLPRADLSGTKLDGANFDGATLMGAVLKGAFIRGATLSGANLQACDASEATLEDLDLDLLHGNGLRLAKAEISRCTFRRAELIGVDLSKARIAHANFDGADLSESTLDGALFEDCTLVDTDISGTTTARNTVLDLCDLTKLRASDGVDLTEASMVKAKINGGRFGSSKLVRANFAFSSLEQADFSGANMTLAVLLSCRLASSRFDGATLADTRFGKSDLPAARFDNASLLRTDLRGCNLFGAEFFEARMVEVQLELANLKGTKLA